MVAFLRKYFGNLYTPLIWTICVMIGCCLPGSMIPNEQAFKIPNFDKLVHVTMFGGFVFLWNLYLTNRSLALPRLLGLFFLFYMLGNIFGISMEIVQKYWIPGRDYDTYDIIADMFGAGIGFGVSGQMFIPVLVKEGATKNKPL
jgi:hypothetical protein